MGALPWSRPPKIDRSSPEAPRLQMERHREANDPVVASCELRPAGATFVAELRVPADLQPGHYLVRAYVASQEAGDGAAARPIEVADAQPPEPPKNDGGR